MKTKILLFFLANLGIVTGLNSCKSKKPLNNSENSTQNQRLKNEEIRKMANEELNKMEKEKK